MNAIDLLEEYQSRDMYNKLVVSTLKLKYNTIETKHARFQNSAMSSHVYQFLSDRLNEPNTWKFKRKIKKILHALGIKDMRRTGRIFFLGIEAQAEDMIKIDYIMKQHYRVRAAYRERIKNTL